MLFRLAGLFAMLAVGAAALAQGYPTKPVRLIVADAAGGAPDQLGRIVAQKLSESLGQQVIVDNRPGAAGVLGADIAAQGAGRRLHAAADDHVDLRAAAQPEEEPALRPGEGLRAGVAHRHRVERAGGERLAAGEIGRRAGRAREGQARRAQLRLGRRRLAGAPRRRDAQPARRHQAHARSLQGRGAGAARRDRRQRAAHHHLADRRRRAHERRPRARARHHRRRAQPGACPSCRRSPTRCRATKSRSRGASSRRPARRRRSSSG